MATEQQISRPVNKVSKEGKNATYLEARRKKSIPLSRISLWSIIVVIFYKAAHKKGRKHDYDVYKKNHPCNREQIVSVIDLQICIGVETSFPEQLSALPYKKRYQEEKEYNKIHLKRG